MRILALETSLRLAHLALLEEDRLLLETALDESERAAKTITPGIKNILREANWSINQLDLIAVTTGPGSFTGLRLGVTTAKTLAFATGAKLIGINTLEVIASQVPQEITSACTVMDAQRRELFTAEFHRDENGQMVTSESATDEATTIVEEELYLSGLTEQQTVTGPGLHGLLDMVNPATNVLDSSLWHPRAAALGKLAYRDLLSGRIDDHFELLPNYFRRSAAEEKWDQLGK